MGKRKQPFGYRMEHGKIVHHPQETALVKHIYEQYASGASYKALADELECQPVRFDGAKPWNINMLARILEDERYTGGDSYPAILSKEMFAAAAAARNTKQVMTPKTEIEKALRQLGCRPVSKSTEAQIMNLLNKIAADPALLEMPSQPSGQEVAAHRTVLDQELARLPVDEEKTRTLAFQTASTQYDAIGSGEYETERLRHIFAEAKRMDSLSADFLRSTVSAVITEYGGKVSLRLKNNQIIGGEQL